MFIPCCNILFIIYTLLSFRLYTICTVWQANQSKFVRAADLKSYYATLSPPHTQTSHTGDKGEVVSSTDLTHTKEPNHPSSTSSELLRLYECPDWLSTDSGDWKFFGPVPS